MGRQYGAPKDQKRQPGAGYSSRKDPAPKVKEDDPSPPSRVVTAFHRNASVDSRPEDIHHTLGNGPNQAARGSHHHDGADSPLLLEGVTLTGSKGGNTALASVILALVKLGAKDSTT